jgi:DNA invertase Pin-like site-specific DNA recombinase
VFIGYVRVSSREQAAGGHSMEAQRRAIRAWAEQRGVNVEIYEDPAYSGRDVNRPRYKQALELLARGDAEGLVVARLDRLSRSLAAFSRLVATAVEQGWPLICLDPALDLSSAGGRLVAHVIGAMAEFERDLISQRTRDGLAVARDNGVRLGRTSRIPPELLARLQAERDAGDNVPRHRTPAQRRRDPHVLRREQVVAQHRALDPRSRVVGACAVAAPSSQSAMRGGLGERLDVIGAPRGDAVSQDLCLRFDVAAAETADRLVTCATAPSRPRRRNEI